MRGQLSDKTNRMTLLLVLLLGFVFQGYFSLISPGIARAISPASAAGGESFLSSDEVFLKLRDPFRRPTLALGERSQKSELETIPVEYFRVVGVTTGPDRVKAMLQTQDGRTFFVSENSRIGPNGGVVSRITPQLVIVKEKKLNSVGQEEEVAFELRLPTQSRL